MYNDRFGSKMMSSSTFLCKRCTHKTLLETPLHVSAIQLSVLLADLLAAMFFLLFKRSWRFFELVCFLLDLFTLQTFIIVVCWCALNLSIFERASPKGAPRFERYGLRGYISIAHYVYEGRICFNDVAMKLSGTLSLFCVHQSRQDTLQATSSGGQDTW